MQDATPLRDASSSTLTLRAITNTLMGDSGANTITGNAANDYIDGGAGNDTLTGGAGNDVLAGGFGNDLLIGGTGSDTFQWSLADKGAAGNPAVDTVQAFDNALPSAGGDVLDLRDLLQGEAHQGNSVGNLLSFVHFQSTGGTDTTIQISSSGGFASGYNAGAVDQTVVLQNADLTAAGTLTDAQVIQNLLAAGKLQVD